LTRRCPGKELAEQHRLPHSPEAIEYPAAIAFPSDLRSSLDYLEVVEEGGPAGKEWRPPSCPGPVRVVDWIHEPIVSDSITVCNGIAYLPIDIFTTEFVGRNAAAGTPSPASRSRSSAGFE
jgi:hypothetical protein